MTVDWFEIMIKCVYMWNKSWRSRNLNCFDFSINGYNLAFYPLKWTTHFRGAKSYNYKCLSINTFWKQFHFCWIVGKIQSGKEKKKRGFMSLCQCLENWINQLLASSQQFLPQLNWMIFTKKIVCHTGESKTKEVLKNEDYIEYKNELA